MSFDFPSIFATKWLYNFFHAEIFNLSIFSPKQGFNNPFWNLNIVLGLWDFHHSIFREILPLHSGTAFFSLNLKFGDFLAPYCLLGFYDPCRDLNIV